MTYVRMVEQCKEFLVTSFNIFYICLQMHANSSSGDEYVPNEENSDSSDDVSHVSEADNDSDNNIAISIQDNNDNVCTEGLHTPRIIKL